MEVLEQIKVKFQKSASNSEKVLLLTFAPKSWGRRRLAKELCASERQTRKVKKLVAENGILSSPNLKKSKTLDSEIENFVKKFYLDDENIRIMPGMKDFVSVKKMMAPVSTFKKS